MKLKRLRFSSIHGDHGNKLEPGRTVVEILELVKELAGELIIVVLFLHYLHSRDKIYDKRLIDMTQLFTQTATEGHEVAAELAKALGDLRLEIARSGAKAVKSK